MRSGGMVPAEIREGDGVEMRDAIERLQAAGFTVRRPRNNDFQLKVGQRLNYYPTRRSAMVDGQKSIRDVTVDDVLAMVRKDIDGSTARFAVVTD